MRIMAARDRSTYAVLSIVTLVAGSMIYVCFRPESLLMFRWAKSIGIANEVHILRETGRSFGHAFPKWMTDSAPYAMWVFSYMLAQRAIWFQSRSWDGYLWILAAPAIAIFSEAAQGLAIIPGTFDVIDLAALVIAAIMGWMVCFTKPSQVNDRRPAKTHRLNRIAIAFHRASRRKRRF